MVSDKLDKWSHRDKTARAPMAGKPPASGARQPNFAEAQRPDKVIRLAHPGQRCESGRDTPD